MIKRLLTIFFTAGAFALSAQQVTNAGFENWTGNVPDNWGTMDQAFAGAGIPGTYNFVTKSTSPNSGSFAATVTTQFIALISQNAPGYLVSGSMGINLSTAQYIFGALPYTGIPTDMTYYVKGTLATGDSAYVQLLFFKWNGTSRDTIGGSIEIIENGITPSYTQHTLPILWQTTGVAPDSVQIVLCSSIASTTPAGTSLTFDDINMVLPVGIQPISMKGNNIIAYPNPASSEINFAWNNNKASQVEVFDITGRKVGSTLLEDGKAKMSLDQFESGIYMYRVLDLEQATLFTGKFNVAK
jgi:hypothetical protein